MRWKTMPEQNTAILQHWLKMVITTPGTLPVKLSSTYSRLHLQETDVILQQQKAGIHERLSIYTNGYLLRLLECMGADYPALKIFLGNDLFHQFAKAYLLQNPSRSFTLYELGTGFPGFLERSRPQRCEGIETVMLQLPAAIATVERARQEVLRAEGLEQLMPAGISLFFPAGIMVQQPPCLRLLELPFPLKAFYEKLISEENYEIPVPIVSRLAISRMRYRIVMEQLEQWQYEFLRACNEPIELMQVIQGTSEKCSMQVETLLAETLLWLPAMYEQGLVMVR